MSEIALNGKTYRILFPDLMPSQTDLAEMEADIREKGIEVPVVVDEDNGIIDGIHRMKLAAKLGLKSVPLDRRSGLTAEQKRQLAKRLNLLRRHMTAEQKREVIAAELRANPEQSNRQVAAALGVSHPTVAAVREELESTGKIFQLEETTGKDGKKRPAKKPPKGRMAAQADMEAAKRKGEEPEQTSDQVELCDSVDQPVPAGLVPVFEKAVEFREIVNQLNAIGRKLKELRDHPAGACMRLGQAEVDLKNLKETVRFDTPYAVCPVCNGNAKTRKANCPCKQRGWLVEASYKNLPSEYRL